jgi:hypothetical protein
MDLVGRDSKQMSAHYTHVGTGSAGESRSGITGGLMEREAAPRGTSQAEDVSRYRRFTEPGFKQKLWKHMIDDIAPSLDTDSCAEMVDADANQETLAIGGLFAWIKFRSAFQILDSVGEKYLNDPDCPADTRTAIQLNRKRRQWLHENAAQCADLIGQMYAKRLLEGDSGGRAKLENLICSIEGRLGIKSRAPTKRRLLPWRFFVALATLESLAERVVPTRKKVIEGAINSCAAFELTVDFGDTTKRDSKIKELRQDELTSRSLKRIIQELELVGLPRKELRF